MTKEGFVVKRVRSSLYNGRGFWGRNSAVQTIRKITLV